MTAQSEMFGMNTLIASRVYGGREEEALRAAEKEVARLEALLSRFVTKSDISRINESAGFGCEKVSEETYRIVSAASGFSKLCGGSFDVTIGPLVDLWSTGKILSEPPEEEKIRRVLPLVDHTGLILDPGRRAVGLKRKGQSIDLGGIGKGFAADCIIEVFRTYGITSAFTNFGGNVATLGPKPDGSPWCIGIQHPRKENGLIGAVFVRNRSVVTSGDYQRCFTDKHGKRHHHILDPGSGYPARSGLVSVTVVADSSTVADAFSTILFVEGMTGGLPLLKSFPGTEAVLVDDNLQVHITGGLKESYRTVDGDKPDIVG